MDTGAPEKKADDRAIHEKMTEAIKLQGAAAAAKAQRVAVDAAQHVPLYAVSPGFELLHKVASAMLVVALLFGLYKVEYPDARPSEIVASVQEAAIAQGAAVAHVFIETWLGLDVFRTTESVSVSIAPAQSSNSAVVDTQ